MAVKGINRAAQLAGKVVTKKVRAKAPRSRPRKSFDKASGKFSGAGSAGVELYSAGSNLGSVAESVKTNSQGRGQAPAASRTGRQLEPERQQARDKLGSLRRRRRKTLPTPSRP